MKDGTYLARFFDIPLVGDDEIIMLGRIRLEKRRFLFLQGPHGPFFSELAAMLTNAGQDVWRVGFNAGDRYFWRDKSRFIACDQPIERWPDLFSDICKTHNITDIVIYGDTRPIHAKAIAIARREDIRVHVFEEGYLRPYWVSYERNGSNGNSRLMNISLDDMRSAQAQHPLTDAEAPAVWGDMREHMFYGALYHWFVLFQNQEYRNFSPHRKQPLWRETLSYTNRLFTTPLLAFRRGWISKKIRRSGRPFHMALMQLAHDSNFLNHGPFANMEGFVRTVIESFAANAPMHHALVFKGHPLESDARELRQLVTETAQEFGVADRVYYVPGGKLAALLEHTRSALTVNSTAAQQALWRQIPTLIFGDAIYGKPGIVADQSLSDFFKSPQRPSKADYTLLRSFLLATSQLPGGFYAKKSRTRLLRLVTDRMLAAHDPYDPVLGSQNSATKLSTELQTNG